MVYYTYIYIFFHSIVMSFNVSITKLTKVYQLVVGAGLKSVATMVENALGI